MKKYKVKYGLGGSFNALTEEILEFENENEAGEYAWESACEIYDTYVGNHGLRDVNQIMEEEDCDEEDAEMIFEEERESWLNYSIQEIKENER